MLGGLSPNSLSMVNTLLASVIAGGIGILAASITQLDTETLPLQIVPALAAALLAGFTSFGIACAAGIGLGILELADPVHLEPVVVPDVRRRRRSRRHRTARSSSSSCCSCICAARSCPVAENWSSGGCPRRRGRSTLSAPTAVGAVVCAIALVVLPFDFREALINTLIGTVMALSLVVITGFVGQISVVAVDARRRVGIHDLAPGGQRRDRVPPGPARRNARRGDPRPDHRRLRAARARA